VLREDPELAETIEPGRREQAIQECTAREVRVPLGHRTGQAPLLPNGGLGLLVLEGALTGNAPIELLDLKRATAADLSNVDGRED